MKQKNDKVSSGLHLDIPGRITATFLELPRSISYEDWAICLTRLAQVHDASNFWIGDCLNHGNNVFGERYSQGASDSGISEDRLVALQYVSSRVAPTVRLKELAWSYHRELAKLDSDDQIRWLTDCRKNGWTIQELKAMLVVAGLRKPEMVAMEGESEIESLRKIANAARALSDTTREEWQATPALVRHRINLVLAALAEYDRQYPA